MRKLASSFFLALATVAMAQNVNVAQSSYRPGDTLRYTIALEGPVVGTVNGVLLQFGLVGAGQDGQKGLNTVLQIDSFKALSKVQYEIDGKIPEVVSGTYQLTTIQVRTAEGGLRSYALGPDFHDDIRIRIDTPQQNLFPRIRSVQPAR
jgi:hypothetical protein